MGPWASKTHHVRRGIGLAKEPRASTNRGGSEVACKVAPAGVMKSPGRGLGSRTV